MFCSRGSLSPFSVAPGPWEFRKLNLSSEIGDIEHKLDNGGGGGDGLELFSCKQGLSPLRLGGKSTGS